DHRLAGRASVSDLQLHVVPAAQGLSGRREGPGAREVRVVGADGGPGESAGVGICAAAQGNAALDRSAAQDGHQRGPSGLEGPRYKLASLPSGKSVADVAEQRSHLSMGVDWLGARIAGAAAHYPWRSPRVRAAC